MEQTVSKHRDVRKAFVTDTNVAKVLLAFHVVLTIFYFFVITFLFPHGNSFLFYLLIAGEIFHIWQVITYLYTVWDTEYLPKRNGRIRPLVHVFITVAGEPLDIIEQTLKAAKAMKYPRFQVFILNDGYVANKENWRDVEFLAKRYGVPCITRTVPGGAKAGNINHALSKTNSELIAIFDADHIPHPDFLTKTVPYFANFRVGFVQTPQFYRNYAENSLTRSAWEQQELFFGPICKGKNRMNSATMCGTNMVLRRSALKEVGGMYEKSIAEDIYTGLLMHENGWRSVYVPEVLAEGLAPEDFASYYKQQYRWARGTLDILFRVRTIFSKKLSIGQKIQYFASASFFVSGWVVLMNASMPLIFFYTGEVPIEVATMALAAVFLPYIFLTIYILQRSSNFAFTFSALVLAMGMFWLQISAFIAWFLRKKDVFSVTSKQKVEGNHIYLVIPHMIYIAAALGGFGVALFREGLSPSTVNNAAWAFLNIGIFLPFVYAAAPEAWKTFIRKKVLRPEPVTVPTHRERTSQYAEDRQ